jgi:hypothetical protein
MSVGLNSVIPNRIRIQPKSIGPDMHYGRIGRNSTAFIEIVEKR